MMFYQDEYLPKSDEKVYQRRWASLVFKIGCRLSSPSLVRFGLKYMPYTSDMGWFEPFDWGSKKLAVVAEQGKA